MGLNAEAANIEQAIFKTIAAGKVRLNDTRRILQEIQTDILTVHHWRSWWHSQDLRVHQCCYEGPELDLTWFMSIWNDGAVAIASLWICTSHCTLRLPFDIATQLDSWYPYSFLPASYLIDWRWTVGHVVAFRLARQRKPGDDRLLHSAIAPQSQLGIKF